MAYEIIDYCGMSVWLSNSRLVHALCKTFDGEYKRIDVPNHGKLFSHEPNIVKALDNGEITVYYTHHYSPATYKYPCTQCKNGQT